MIARARQPLVFALAAAALAVGVILLALSRLAPLPGAGFEERITPGERCDGTATASFVREPFVREEASSPPRCVQWTSSLAVRSKMRAHVEMTVEGDATVSIDGRPLMADQGAQAARSRSAFTELAPGVHAFVATFRVQQGAGYLRLGMDDELEPHDLSIVAPLDEDAFFTSPADARRALDAPPRPRPVWQALLAALALAGAGVLAWLAVRARRARALPRSELIAGASIFALALFLRAHALDLQDTSWDELTYVTAGQHYVRNVVLGDYFAEAWRHNFEHAPNTKWILGLGELLGGLGGARVFVSVLGSLAAAFVFAFGRIAFGPRVGAIAGALTAVMPLLVAHGRVAGHDTMVLFWWSASMLALACWVESRGDADAPSRGDPLAAFLCIFCATAGVFSRATTVWIFPLLVTAWLLGPRATFTKRLRAFPLAAVVGGAAALALVFAVWPFMWSGQGEKLTRITGHWAQPWGDIEVYMGKLRLPAAHYFLVAFLAETPALLLFAAAAGVVLALRRGPGRVWGILCILWLVLPFAQSVSTLRIGAGRYVIQAWPALALLAAVALVALGDALAALAFQLSKRGRALLGAVPGVLAVLYTYVALARVEPYPLDYFDELVGGPSGVAERKMFEVPWWGEGNRAAVRDLNRVADNGARVHLLLWPTHAIERLRDDLVPVEDATKADYVLVSHLQYFAKPPAGCDEIGHVEVQGARLVDTYRCHPVSPSQLGFAAMNRGAVDEALRDFREALGHDPRDPSALFGLGWAAQVKGDARQAESLYVQAASRAAQANDPETEYFARFNLGTLYAQQGRSDLAVDTFRGALVVTDRAPERFADRAWTVWLNLGLALHAGGRDADARAALLRAQSLKPSDPSIEAALRQLDAPREAGADAR